MSAPRPSPPWRSSLVAALLLLASPPQSTAQSATSCNPLQGSCPPDMALGMTIDVEFGRGSVDSFVSSGSPTYDPSSGVLFTVASGGQAPQLRSIFYIMFGRIEIALRAAPGPGIVSSLVLQSDDLDEIDLEWLGSDPAEVQSNYFGKGDVTTYNRGEFHTVPDGGTQSGFRTYAIDWTADRIIWSVDGTQLRVLQASDADPGQYPQTPMLIKFGAWAGGDPAYNAPGTVAWARGPTDYSQGPFTMAVRSLIVTDYSTGSAYSYGDASGTWGSIVAAGGRVNGNADGAGPTQTLTATAAAGSGAADVPTGIGSDQNGAIPTTGSIPAGWRLTPDGKVVPDAASAVAASLWLAVAAAAAGTLFAVRFGM